MNEFWQYFWITLCLNWRINNYLWPTQQNQVPGYEVFHWTQSTSKNIEQKDGISERLIKENNWQEKGQKYISNF